MPRLIVALPAYNEEDCLPPLLRSFNKLFSQLPPEADPLVIVVDDGSKDATAAVCRKYARKMPVKLVQHEKNKGLGEAIKTGLRAALEEVTGPDDVIVCMDADNTHPPRAVHRMLKLIAEEGADIVIASRYRRGSRQVGVPPHRQFMSYGARLLFWMFLNLDGVRDYTCGFRAYRADLIRRAFEKYGDDIIRRNGFACTDELLVNLACIGEVEIREIPFVLRYDLKVGESKLDLGLTLKETFRLLMEGRNQLRRHRRGDG
ncbi:MAG: glycosyltransferase family 2 protein [Candidatus Sumerlaeia bacterium]|nr:glycosyltransferase family 2 protein [Candidatus Sumerlaeia bacterium]